MERRHSTNNNGFTLIEVLVALAVVSGVFLVILTSFSFHLDIFERKKENLKLVLKAKENLYLFRKGKLLETEGTKDGIKYNITTEDMEYDLKKVTSTVSAGKDDASVLLYIKK